jgi:hypothetical protein
MREHSTRICVNTEFASAASPPPRSTSSLRSGRVRLNRTSDYLGVQTFSAYIIRNYTVSYGYTMIRYKA